MGGYDVIGDNRSDRYWAFFGGLALLVFSLLFVINARRGGLWTDELFTIWASDPAISPWQLQFDRLRYETNPPLHFWVLYVLRHIVPEGRLAGLILNFMVVLATLTAVILMLRRDGRPRLGYVLAIVFLLNSATLIYVQEVRAYLLTIGFCVLLAVQVMRLIRDGRGHIAILAATGAAAGLSHVYGALFAGALSAAMVVEGVISRKPDLSRAGLILGTACSLPFTVWFMGVSFQEGGSLRNIGWISFSLAQIQATIKGILRLCFGSHLWLVLWLTALAAVVTSAVARRSGLIAAIAAAIFLISPFVISAKVPILHYRYFAVAIPALMVLLAFCARDAWQGDDPYWRKGAAAVLLAVPVMTSLPVSWGELTHKLLWRGAEIVRANAAQCPSATVRGMIYNDAKVRPIFPFTYEYLLQGTGLKIVGSETKADISDLDCRIVAWVEHNGFVSGTMNETLLLKRLNLTNRKHVPLAVYRHSNGLVVLKAD